MLWPQVDYIGGSPPISPPVPLVSAFTLQITTSHPRTSSLNAQLRENAAPFGTTCLLCVKKVTPDKIPEQLWDFPFSLSFKDLRPILPVAPALYVLSRFIVIFSERKNPISLSWLEENTLEFWKHIHYHSNVYTQSPCYLCRKPAESPILATAQKTYHPI